MSSQGLARRLGHVVAQCLLIAMLVSVGGLAFCQKALAHAAQGPTGPVVYHTTQMIPADSAMCHALLSAHPEIRKNKAAMAQGCNFAVDHKVLSNDSRVQAAAAISPNCVEAPGIQPDCGGGGGGCVPANPEWTLWTQDAQYGPYDEFHVEQDAEWIGDTCSLPSVVSGSHNCTPNLWSIPLTTIGVGYCSDYANGAYRTAQGGWIYCVDFGGCASYQLYTDMPTSMLLDQIQYRQSW